MRVRRTLDIRLIALCTTCFLLPAIACPSQCVCKWKNGKRYVECSDKELKAIPNSLDSETQVLDFTGNDLQVLQKETFHKLGLLDLQKIYLQRCSLQKIEDTAFKGLANLVELDLSNNYLTVVPSSNFVHFPSLMRLSLNNNPITSIKTRCFHNLNYLSTLELTDCKIESVEMEAFAGLGHLEWLRLNGNRLSNIQGENLFPDTLRGINLQNNNWNCDCHLRDLHSWLVNFNMPHAVEPVCSLPPRLRKRTITSVTENEFACLPKITPSTVYLEANLGSNITLECFVKAIPEAKITWLYQGQVIHNYSTMSPEQYRDIFFVENGVSDKKSELHIYNIGPEDNGTYTCAAENPAGRSRANYTIKILVKEEPVVIVVTFPQRHLVVIVTVIFLIIVLLIAIIAVVLLKFKTDSRSRKKKESGKDVALCNQILPSSRSNGNLPKNNGSLIVNAHSHHALHYTVQTGRDYDSNDVYQSNNMKGFVDRNPDLISDAETVANNAQNENVLSVYKQSANGDCFEEETTFTGNPMPRQVTWQDQQPHSMTIPPQSINNMYQHSADVHLNPGCFLDSEGYPYDYGLPKHPCRPPMMSNYSVVGPFYQTLPHKRPQGQKLVCKFAKDTEFNTPPPTCPNFEMFNATTVRRTLEGYPVTRNRPIAFVGNGTVYYNEEFVPSPPEGYKSEPVQCCAPSEGCASWVNPKGTCAVMVPMSVAEGAGRCYQVETRCVDTQTTDARLPGEGTDAVLKSLPQVSNAKCAADICSESPDEGYVGDANDI